MEIASARSKGGLRRALRRAAWALERRLDELRRRLQARGNRPLRLVPYRGYGGDGLLFVQGRVVEDRRVGRARAGDSAWDNFKASYKRLFTREVPRILVRARLGRAVAETRTDAEGYFRFLLDGGAACGPRWRQVHLSLPGVEGRVAARADVLVAPAAARFGIISDIDDTILPSGATRWLQAARLMLFGNAHTRVPFPGVAAFYRALQRGPGGDGENPVFYLSGSPWNLYDLLEQCLDTHGLPKGPIMLRDYGPVRGHLLDAHHREHKLARMEHLLRVCPGLPFVLIGDSSLEDPEIYRELALAFPGRVRAIYIRDVGSVARARRVREIARELARAGVSLRLIADTAEAAAHAAAVGLIGARPSLRQRESASV